MKNRTILLIDGENIGHNRADDIERLARRLGSVTKRRVYHLRNDPATRPWAEKSREGRYTDIPLDGTPEKDKIDRKIQEDARHFMRSPKYDRVCIVSSDGGYCCLSEETAAEEKLCFIGERKAPQRLRRAGLCFMELG
ncbi:MAG: NYN domain-containing protein [Oscillospiraceae bacterium]|nr:NYN domain-containing protein [Oscillospiraceae bacterium]